MSVCSLRAGKKEYMPRGFVFPALRQQLFNAAWRVLSREGPSGLSGRALTREAGCATGLINNHFDSFDAFLAEFLADGFEKALASASVLPSQAGQGSVVGNLTNSALAVFSRETADALDLIRSRPYLRSEVRSTPGGRPIIGALHQIEKIFTLYLDAEKSLRRVRVEADTKALASVLVGTAQYLAMSHEIEIRDLSHEVQGIVGTIMSGVVQ
jgi:AcrR family transcriptional regulator